MGKWIITGLLSAAVAFIIWRFLPHEGIPLVIFLVTVTFMLLSLAGFLYTLAVQVIRSLPVIPEQNIAVLTRDGRHIGFQGPGRMYRWLLKPLLYPLDEIKTIIPRTPIVFQTPTESILIREGIEVQSGLQMSYRLGPANDDIYNAAFRAPAPLGWKDAIEKTIAPAALRAIMVNETLRNLIENQAQINTRIRQEISDRIRPWGFEVQWIQLTDFHVPPAVNEALVRGMQLRSISERLSEAAKERLRVIEAALAQNLDPREVVTPHDILILRYIESLEKLGESPATKVVLPYDILEATASLRGALWGGQTTGQTPQGAVPPSAPSSQASPSQAVPAPQTSAPQQAAAPTQPASPSEAPDTAPETTKLV